MKKLLLLITVALLANNANAQWQTNGPYGGNITCLAANGSNVFAGVYYGGVYLTTNNGISWTTVNTGLPNNLYVNSLAVSGSNIFLGMDSGVYLSTNNGGNWTAVNTGLPAYTGVRALATNGSNIFAGTDYGVYLSTNNGGNWVAVNTGLTDSASASVLATSDSDIFVATTGGVYLSTNNGGNWTTVNTGLMDSANVSALVIKGSNIFAGTADSGVYLSTNNGGDWTAVNTGLSADIDVLSLTTSGSNIFVGFYAGGVYLSTNNGANWTAVNTGIQGFYNVNALAISGSNIFAATVGDDYGGSVFLSTNNGGNWTNTLSLQDDASISSLAISGSSIFAATFSGHTIYDGGGGVFLSTNNGGSWTTVNTGLTAGYNGVTSLAISGSNIFAGTYNGGVYLSTNNGGNWTSVNTGLPNNLYVTSLAISGSNIFAGTADSGVYLSTNNGGNWVEVNNGLTAGYYGVASLAIRGSNIFAGTDDGVYLSTNNGSSWTGIGLGNYDVYSLAISGSNIFAGTNTGGVFLSTNNGGSWTATGLAGQNSAVLSLAISGSNIFAVAAGGVFLSTNNGGNWTAVNPSVPAIAYSLAISDSTIFVGGNSVWQQALGVVSPPFLVWPGDANDDLVVNNYDLLPIGLYYGETGTMRASVTNDWAAQTSADWSSLQSDGYNLKFVDCNGDGIINSDDTLAVTLNYGDTHMYHLLGGGSSNSRSGGVPLYFVADSNSYQAGSRVHIAVWLGNATTQIANLYGLGYDIALDNSLIQAGTISFNYVNSFIGTENNDALSLTHISNDVETAVTRIDHTNKSGYGKIGDLYFTLNSSISNPQLLISVSSSLAVDSAGNPISIQAATDTLNVITTGINQISANDNHFSIYPNPANGSFVVETTATEKQLLQVFDITGNLMLTQTIQNGNTTVDAGNLASGVYLVSLKNSEGVTTNEKLVITK